MGRMEAAWEVVERAGVPFGQHEAPPDLGDRARIAAAVHEVLDAKQRLDPRQRVSLLAWLGAWSSDWPSSFHATFGPDAQALLARAGEGVDDLGRYLTLGRIAREKLARRP